MIQIVDYNQTHAAAFRDLNIDWLDQYGLTESHDLEILDDPEGHILAGGGGIFMAVDNDRPIGSAAVIAEGDGVFELAKMAVAKSHQGRGISRLLIEKCLEFARGQKASKMILVSNHQLKAALALYEKYGFRHVPVIDSPYATADVRMELIL